MLLTVLVEDRDKRLACVQDGNALGSDGEWQDFDRVRDSPTWPRQTSAKEEEEDHSHDCRSSLLIAGICIDSRTAHPDGKRKQHPDGCAEEQRTPTDLVDKHGRDNRDDEVKDGQAAIEKSLLI
jgi:hypothetical protein